MRDANNDGHVDWHDLYTEALSPVQKAAIKIGDLLFTPLSALLHTVWFALWFLLKLDINLLTLIVSLEAIYITLFIGLGQKLADKRSAIHADHDRHEAQQSEAHREKLAETQQQLLVENTRLTEQIVTLTEAVHRAICHTDHAEDRPDGRVLG
jgi:uncharacterized membrane protein